MVDDSTKLTRPLLIYVPEMAAYGGMEQHVCNAAEYCAGGGTTVTMMTTSRSLSAKRRARLLASGVDFVEMNVERGRSSGLRKLIWIVTRLVARSGRWQSVYTNGQSGLVKTVAGICRRRGAMQLAHHHHTSADEREVANWTELYRKVLAETKCLVGCSKTTRRNLAKATGRDDVAFLPYITSPIVSRESIQGRKSFGGTVRIGYFGRLVSTKGIDTICALSAEPRLRGVLWEIYGKGEGYSADFFAPHKNVRYNGAYRGLREYAEALRRIDGVVLLSEHNEGMPLSLIEAMAANCTWIASDQGGVKELVAEGSRAVVVPHGASFADILETVVRFVGSLSEGGSRPAQERNLYDSFLLPETVGILWGQFLTCGRTSERSSVGQEGSTGLDRRTSNHGASAADADGVRSDSGS